jgi:hypothetical protein
MFGMAAEVAPVLVEMVSMEPILAAKVEMVEMVVQL